MNYLFKQNLILRAKSAYKGNWIIASQIFDIYSYLMDIRNRELEYDLKTEEFSDKYPGSDLLELWIGTYREHNKHITIDLDLVQDITPTLKIVSPFFKKNYRDRNITPLLSMYKLGKYKELLQNLISYITKFFKELGIDVKPIKIKSQYTDLNIYAITPNLSSSEDYVSSQININTTIKNKIFNKYKETYAKQGLDLVDDGGNYYTLYDNDKIVQGYIIPGQWDNVISSNTELNESLRKNTLINDNYDKLSYSKGALYTPKGSLIKKLDFLPTSTLHDEIAKYEFALNKHNETLNPYEPKLSNEPKTIQLGDHSLKVVKVFYKNITRPVIVEGPYTGLFLDQMVSPSGKVIGSSLKASPYFTENTQIVQSLGNTKKNIKVKDTLDIEQSHNVVTKRVQDYQGKSSHLLNKAVFNVVDPWGDEEGSLVKYDKIKLPKKIKDKLDKLSGLCFLPDMFGRDILDEQSLSLTSDFDTAGGKSTQISINLGDNQNITTKVYLHTGGVPNAIENVLFQLDPCLPEGFATRVMTQQIKSASELGFEKVFLGAGGPPDMVGYYVWPKLGYNSRIQMKYYLENIIGNNSAIPKPKTKTPKKTTQYISQNFLSLVEQYYPEVFDIQKWFKDIQGIDILEPGLTITFLDLYACKVNGKFIGQQFWKKHGEYADLEFDLTPGSLSMRIFGKYIELKSKIEGIPVEDYLNTNYSKYSNKSKNLECLLENYYGGSVTREELNQAIDIAIANHENGNIFVLLENPSLITKLRKDYVLTDKDLEKLRTIARINKLDSHMKFASSKKPANMNTILKDLDMNILDQVWDGVNKLYESGNF